LINFDVVEDGTLRVPRESVMRRTAKTFPPMGRHINTLPSLLPQKLQILHAEMKTGYVIHELPWRIWRSSD
jgi:hypothetical protein